MGKAKRKQQERPDAATRGRQNKERVGIGFEDATPERLRKAGREGASIDPQGVRRLADPFDVLRAKHLLDRENAAMNEVLWHAGERYRDIWQASGMNGLAAMDLSKDIVDGGSSAGGVPASEHAVRARQDLRAANGVIGPRHASLFCAIILYCRTVASQRHLCTESRHERVADALLIDRLRDVLHRLCDLWGMKANDRPRKISSWNA